MGLSLLEATVVLRRGIAGRFGLKRALFLALCKTSFLESDNLSRSLDTAQPALAGAVA
jgi:hypothetical protein